VEDRVGLDDFRFYAVWALSGADETIALGIAEELRVATGYPESRLPFIAARVMKELCRSLDDLRRGGRP
jgi:hypothetical protein